MELLVMRGSNFCQGNPVFGKKKKKKASDSEKNPV